MFLPGMSAAKDGRSQAHMDVLVAVPGRNTRHTRMPPNKKAGKMTILQSKINPRSEEFQANQESMAKAVADLWKVPLLRLDVGALLSSDGSTEEGLRRTVQIAESLAPVVLWVDEIEKACGQEGDKEFLPMQPGDVIQTQADVNLARDLIGYDPKTKIDVGIPKFVEWYREFYT